MMEIVLVLAFTTLELEFEFDWKELDKLEYVKPFLIKYEPLLNYRSKAFQRNAVISARQCLVNLSIDVVRAWAELRTTCPLESS